MDIENIRIKCVEIEKWLRDHKDELLGFLSELVSVESVAKRTDSSEAPFGEGTGKVLLKMLEDGRTYGFAVENYLNEIGRISLTDEEDPSLSSLGIWAHLDVVPVSDGWQSDPFKAEIRDGFIFGRGVGDNKGAACGTLFLFRAIRELGIKTKPVHLYLGTDEESGMEDVSDFLKYYPVPDFNIVPDAGFPGAYGETGRLVFKLISPALRTPFTRLSAGTVLNIVPDTAVAVIDMDEKPLEIKTEGKASHAAAPERGVNAAALLFKKLTGLREVSEADKDIIEKLGTLSEDYSGAVLGIDGEDELSGKTSAAATITRLEGKRISLEFDCRFNSSNNTERLIGSIKQWADENGFELLVESRKEASICTEPETIDLLVKVYEELSGKKVGRLPVMKGGTYAGKLPRAFATGFISEFLRPEGLPEGHGGAHQPDECIPIEEYIKGLVILAAFILRLAA